MTESSESERWIGSGRYDKYNYLDCSAPAPGVLQVVLDRPDRLNAMDETFHGELAAVWGDIDDDPDVDAVVITGRGRAFSAGGDFAMLRHHVEDDLSRAAGLEATKRLVRNVLDFSKPLVSAINGVAVGAGLAVALLADIPIAARSARILDGHIRLGVTAGDHATLLWPLLCGMAKTKYYLLTGAEIDGTEAERLGLVALVTEDDALLPTALQVAERLAAGPPGAIRTTKEALNQWPRAFMPTFEYSAALEFLSFGGSEAREGLASHLERRPPRFRGARS